MKKSRAVVLEKNGSTYTLLTGDGEFISINLPKEAVVGEEVEIQESFEVESPLRSRLTHAGFRRWGSLASIAAVLIFAIIFTFQWNLFSQPVAVAAISLDINPRLELTLDKKSRVLEVNAVNEDAENLVKSLKLNGREFEQALSEIIREAANQNFLTQEHDWVVIGISSLDGEVSALPESLAEENIQRTIIRETDTIGLISKVATFQVSSEERTRAITDGLTTGEYGLYKMSKQVGLELKPETLKDTKERIKVLENEVIQQEINKKLRVLQEKNKGKNADKNKNKDKDKDKDNNKDKDKDKDNEDQNRENVKNLNLNVNIDSNNELQSNKEFKIEQSLSPWLSQGEGVQKDKDSKKVIDIKPEQRKDASNEEKNNEQKKNDREKVKDSKKDKD